MGKAGRRAGQVRSGHKRPKTEAAEEEDKTCDVPYATTLLTPALQDELHRVWHETTPAATCEHSPADQVERDTMRCVPAFKVGRQELYKRFADAYDAFMRHHNCSALRDYLDSDIISRITRTSGNHSDSAGMNVADFGCGTGRIGELLIGSTRVTRLYAYDSAPAMLQRCLVNLVRAAKKAGRYDTVMLQPAASSDHISEASSLLPSPILLAGEDVGSVRAQQSAQHTLSLCVRPCSFAAVQRGFLRSSHHPPCQLIVCAWALSYVMREQWGEDKWHAAVDSVVQELVALLDTRTSDAALVIIETLGNGAASPTRRNTLMERLEQEHGFVRHWLHTDYEFSSVAEAVHMLRFFFGEKTAETVRASGATVWPECTGVWTLWRSAQT